MISIENIVFKKNAAFYISKNFIKIGNKMLLCVYECGSFFLNENKGQ